VLCEMRIQKEQPLCVQAEAAKSTSFVGAVAKRPRVARGVYFIRAAGRSMRDEAE